MDLATDARKNGAAVETLDRAPIFCEANRPFWNMVRRFMIGFLRMLDEAYGWRTFER